MPADFRDRFRITQVLLTLCCLGPTGIAGADDAEQELARLQGNWIVVSAEIGGKPVDADDLKDIRRTVKGDEIAWLFEGDVFLRTRFKIDPAQNPKRWDATLTFVDVGEGEVVEKRLGIYELKDDALKICVAGPDEERPVDFSTRPKSEGVLIVLKRE
jgi:uncharacterized protein (TIGR03067 family)